MFVIRNSKSIVKSSQQRLAAGVVWGFPALKGADRNSKISSANTGSWQEILIARATDEKVSFKDSTLRGGEGGRKSTSTGRAGGQMQL